MGAMATTVNVWHAQLKTNIHQILVLQLIKKSLLGQE